MADWIEQEAKKIDDGKAQQKEEWDKIDAKTALVSKQVPHLFDSVREAIERDIELFNQHFPKYNEKLNSLERIGDKKLQVRRAYDPFFRLEVTLEETPFPQISFIIETPNMIDGQLCQSDSGRFGFSLDDQTGVVHLTGRGTHLTPQDISKHLLRPAVKSLRE
jgi:hypothetical protein